MEWKTIKDYPNYEVSSTGLIRNATTGRVLKGSSGNKTSKGTYQLVLLFNESGKKMLQAHRIVAKHFIPNPLGKPCVNHIDGNPRNNDVGNLEWVTYKENSRHAVRTGLNSPRERKKDSGATPRGSQVPNSTLNEEVVLEIKKRLEQGETQKSLADYFEVSQLTIGKIARGESWRHVLIGDRVAISTRKRKGTGATPRAVLTPDDVRVIRNLAFEARMSNEELATMYGVSEITISNLLSGRTWKHIK